MGRRLGLFTLLLALAGCPGGGAPAGGTGRLPQVGQRWRFRFGALGEQMYEVTSVTPSAVRYRVHTLGGDDPLGEPLEQDFPLRPGPGPLEVGEPGPPLVVGELTLETWVSQDGGHRVTTAVSGRRPVFPGVLRVQRGDEVLVELVDVR